MAMPLVDGWDSRAKYLHRNNLLIHFLGLPPLSGAVSNMIQIKYGTITTHNGGKDMRRQKKKRQIGRSKAQVATASVWSRRLGGMERGANLELGDG